MGAKCLFKIEVEKTKASQAERELQRRVEAHTGRRISDWKASCTSYLPRDANRQPVVVAVLSEKPYSRFVATGKTITETDHGFDALLDKVKSYTRKSQAYAKGVEYDLADFRTRVGMIMDKNTPTGPVLEIEYRPCSVLEDCVKLITELMDRIAAPLVALPDAGQDTQANVAANMSFQHTLINVDFSKYFKEEEFGFTPKHSSLLYLQLLARNWNE